MVETKGREEKFFSTKEKAESWLVNHGYVYGKSNKFANTKGCYWFHQDDVPGKHVIVEICEAIVDEEAYE